MNLFDDEGWSPPESLPNIPGGWVALDLETRDNGINDGLGPGWPFGGGYPIGYALAWRQGEQLQSTYLPVRHDGGGNLDQNMVEGWMKDLLKRDDITFVFANGGYDRGWCRRQGLAHHIQKTLDIQIMAPLLDEYRWSYSLDALCQDYTTVRKGSGGLIEKAKAWGLKDAWAEMYKLPSSSVGQYAEDDARGTLLVAEALAPLIERDGLQAACDLEHKVQTVLLDMRWAGIRVDLNGLERLERKYRGIEAAAVQSVYDLTGVRIDPWATDSITRALTNENSALELPTTATGMTSITQDVLNALIAAGSKVAPAVLTARRYQKARSTFLEGVFGRHERGGRIYPEFHPLRIDRPDGSKYGTVSYRFSCTNPGMQILPGRDGEMAPEIRGLVLPEPGDLFISADYSQQEPRQGIHFAARASDGNLGDPELSELARSAREKAGKIVEDILADPSWHFHRYASALVGIPIKEIKPISLGRMYGAGDARIAEEAGWELYDEVAKNGRTYKRLGPEAKAKLDEYDQKFPWKEMSRLLESIADRRGWIRLAEGYRARFSRRGGRNGDFPTKAFNRLIQGSSAVQTKKALVLAHGAGIKLRLQVHDELGASGQESDAKVLADCMQEAHKLCIPMKVDLAMGQSWGECL